MLIRIAYHPLFGNSQIMTACCIVPIVVINPFALKPMALHETGHQADVERCSMHHFGNLVIVPLGVVWVVQPAAKKITEYVCEPLLKKGVDLASSLTERVTGSKTVANGVSGTLSVVKEIGKYVGAMGIVFVSCIGIEALNAALKRGEEKFADDFACKHAKDAWELGMEGKEYDWLVESEKLEKTAHPIISWINELFASHPSHESRADKYFFHAAVESLKKIAKSDANKSLVDVAVKRLVAGKNKEKMFEEIVDK